MRRKIEYTYISPITNKEEKSFTEAFFVEGQNLISQIEVYFETRIASLSTLISYKEIPIKKARN